MQQIIMMSEMVEVECEERTRRKKELEGKEKTVEDIYQLERITIKLHHNRVCNFSFSHSLESLFFCFMNGERMGKYECDL